MTAQSSENQELKAIPSVIRYFRAGNLETKNEIKEAVREFSLGSFSLFLISIDAKYVYYRPLPSLTLYVNPSVDWLVPRTYCIWSFCIKEALNILITNLMGGEGGSYLYHFQIDR